MKPMDLIEKCKVEFELLTKIQYDETNPLHVSVIDDMVSYRESQKGNEGLKSLSLSGVTESYKYDYPKNVMRILKELKKRVQFL